MWPDAAPEQDREAPLSELSNKRQPKQPERGNRPLWFAIAGLLISVFSYSMSDMMIGDVVFWFGGVLAFLGVLYWFVQPRHGL